MKNLTINEKVIQFLLSLEPDSYNRVDIYKKTLLKQDISEQEFIQEIVKLQTDGFIKIHWMTGHHDNIDHGVNIELLSPIIHYDDNKKEIDVVKKLRMPCLRM